MVASRCGLVRCGAVQGCVCGGGSFYLYGNTAGVALVGVGCDGGAETLAVAPFVAAAGVVEALLDEVVRGEFEVAGLEQRGLEDATALGGPELPLRSEGAGVGRGVRGFGAELAQLPGVAEELGRGLGDAARGCLEVVRGVVVEVAAEAPRASLPARVQAHVHPGAFVPLQHQTEVRHIQEDEQAHASRDDPPCARINGASFSGA
jgi:hypothetical protein